MPFRITIISSDYFGPALCRELAQIIQTLNSFRGECEIHERLIGEAAIRASGTPLPESTLHACLESDAVLVGAHEEKECWDADGHLGAKEYLHRLRSLLGGFVNLSPIVALRSAVEFSYKSRIEDAEVLVVREIPRTYFTKDISNQNWVHSCTQGIERVAHVAFEQARARRKRVVSINTTEVLDRLGIWRSTMAKVGQLYPDIKLDHMNVDSFTMNLAANPKHFDVIVTPNLFGKTLAGEAAAIVGCIHRLPTITMTRNADLYEVMLAPPADIEGSDIANPIGAITAIAMMLRNSAGMHVEANHLELAIHRALKSGYHPPRVASQGVTHSAYKPDIGSLIGEAFMDRLNKHYAYHAV